MLKLLVAIILLISVAAVGIFLVSANRNADVYVRPDAQVLMYSDTPSSEAITVAAGGTSAATPPSSGTTGDSTSAVSLVGGKWKQAFFCSFANSPTGCGFRLQAKERGRATIVNFGRDGGTALRLHTEPGDNYVAGSETMERTDLWLTQADTGCYEGREQVWELSVLFPDDFVFPKWHRYALAGFHHSGPTGQGNFTLGFERGATDSSPGILGFQLYGGATVNSGQVKAQLWPANEIQRNVWYDFVYHIRWSSGSDGFFDAWVNGVKKLSHRGPTLYKGQGCYLKLANYHAPLCDPYPACIGVTNRPSSVIYDRVIRHDVAATQGDGRFRPLPGRSRSSQRESIARR
jgi:hypothetical protein